MKHTLIFYIVLFIIVIVGVVFGRISPHVSGGYRWVDSLTPEAFIGAEWIDIAQTGTPIAWYGETPFYALDLPFTVSLYGSNYTRIYCYENGFVSFQPGGIEYADLSATPPNATIAALNFNGRLIRNGQIFYQEVGPTNNRKFIIQYDSVYYTAIKNQTFQFVFYEQSNTIQINYKNTRSIHPVPFYQAGIDAPDGSHMLRYNACENLGTNAFSVLFTTSVVESTPTLSITRPNTDDKTYSEYHITWTDFDTDDDAVIDLFYSSSSNFNTTNIIVAGLSEDDSTDAYIWDTGSVPTRTNYIFGRIYDNHQTNWSYAAGSVIIGSLTNYGQPYHEDFQWGAGGWVQGPSDYVYPVWGSVKALHLANIGSNHMSPFHASVESPWISFTNAAEYILRFSRTNDGNTYMSNLMVYITTNNTDWHLLKNYTKASASINYYRKSTFEIDVSAYFNHTIRIRFVGIFEYANQYWLDDIALVEGNNRVDGTGIVIYDDEGYPAVPNSVYRLGIKYIAETNISGGTLWIELPNEFSNVQTNNASAEGYIDITPFGGASLLSNRLVTATDLVLYFDHCTTGQGYHIILGSTNSGGPGIRAPASTSYASFQAWTKSSNGSFTAITAPGFWIRWSSSPINYRFLSPKSGVADASAQIIISGYVRSDHPIINGVVRLTFPTNFTPPQVTNANTPGFFSVSLASPHDRLNGTPNISINSGNYYIDIPVRYCAHKIYCYYGTNGNSVTLPSQSGNYPFSFSARSTNTAFTAPRTHNYTVIPGWNDISGKAWLTPPMIEPNISRTLTFYYSTHGEIPMTNGIVSFEIPAGWSSPQTTNASADGYVYINRSSFGPHVGRLTATGNGPWMISVFVTNLPVNNNFNLRYTTIIPNETTYTLAITVSNHAVPMTNIISEPTIFIQAKDGSGQLFLQSESNVYTGTPTVLKFKYQCDYPLPGGEMVISLPTNFTIPQFTSSTNNGLFVITGISGYGNKRLGIPYTSPTNNREVHIPIYAASPVTVYCEYHTDTPEYTGLNTIHGYSREAGGTLRELHNSPIPLQIIYGNYMNVSLDPNVNCGPAQRGTWVVTFEAKRSLNNAVLRIHQPIRWSKIQTNHNLPGALNITTEGADIDLTSLVLYDIGTTYLDIPIITMQQGDKIHFFYGDTSYSENGKAVTQPYPGTAHFKCELLPAGDTSYHCIASSPHIEIIAGLGPPPDPTVTARPQPPTDPPIAGPNPWHPNESELIIHNVPSGASVWIWDAVGNRVVELNSNPFADSYDYTIRWNGRLPNSSTIIAPGIYYLQVWRYIADTDSETLSLETETIRIQKLAVIR